MPQLCMSQWLLKGLSYDDTFWQHINNDLNPSNYVIDINMPNCQSTIYDPANKKISRCIETASPKPKTDLSQLIMNLMVFGFWLNMVYSSIFIRPTCPNVPVCYQHKQITFWTCSIASQHLIMHATRYNISNKTFVIARIHTNKFLRRWTND